MALPRRIDAISARCQKRFWTKIDRTGDCWIWIRGINSRGYGTLMDQLTILQATRVAYFLIRGEDAAKPLKNLCGNKLCVNPDHHRLFVALPDYVKPKRLSKARGMIGSRYLSNSKINEILAARNLSQDATAARFKVSQSTVSLIRNGWLKPSERRRP
jgi:hypothetical protein